MEKNERWVYRDNELVEKITEKTYGDGSKEIVHQKASSELGGFVRTAGEVTSRERISAPKNS